MVPINPLQFVSRKMSFNSIPLRMFGLELTSSMAARSAGFVAPPMTEFKVKRAPIFITFGFKEDDELPVLQKAPRGNHMKIQSLNKIKVLFMNPEISKTSFMFLQDQKKKTKL